MKAFNEERLLVQQCLNGDAKAITALVERFQGDVYGLCYRLLHHSQDAEDVTQEVFLRIFRSLHRWDQSRPLKPWIMAITVNRCRTWMGQRARIPESADYLHETVATKPTDDCAELLTELEGAMDNLREDYRSVFVMFHEQGLPYEEIAVALDRPVGTIKTWLHRARIQVLDRLRSRGMVSEVGNELP